MKQRWIKITALAMSFPSTIFIAAYASMELTKRGHLSQLQGILLFLGIILNTLFLMVYYAYKKKN